MGTNVFSGNIYPLATYGGLLASLLCVSLDAQVSDVDSVEKSDLNVIQPLSLTSSELFTLDSYNSVTSFNIFSPVYSEASDILTRFVDAIIKDSTPLAPEVEEYINDIFWDLV